MLAANVYQNIGSVSGEGGELGGGGVQTRTKTQFKLHERQGHSDQEKGPTLSVTKL